MNRIAFTCCLTLAVAAATGHAFARQQIFTRGVLDSLLEGDQILEDFEAFNVNPNTSQVLDVNSLDSTTIANGQGPRLVEECARYYVNNLHRLRWNGAGYVGVPTRTLMGDNGFLFIEYPGAGMNAVGFDIHGLDPHVGTVIFTDVNNVELGRVNYNYAGNPIFIGWWREAAYGIGSVSIRGGGGQPGPIIDDHGYGRWRPKISVRGACPGQVTVTWDYATPNRPMAFLFSKNEGNATIPGGACAGTQLGLRATIHNVSPPLPNNTGPGSGLAAVQVSSVACGGYLQLVVHEPTDWCWTCSTSNVARVP